MADAGLYFVVYDIKQIENRETVFFGPSNISDEKLAFIKQIILQKDVNALDIK